MAKAAIETACWDLEAKSAGVPLWKHLGGTRPEIACGVSIGIQDTPEILLEKIRKEVDAGYQRIKIKIKPGWDLKIIERVRKEFPDIRLMGDANSAYKLSDVSLFQQLDHFNLDDARAATGARRHLRSRDPPKTDQNSCMPG